MGVTGNDKNIIAMIPARMGSERLKMKNLALLRGKPLIYYAIDAAKRAGIFRKIVVNSENEIFENIANRYNVAFYKRPLSLGLSSAKSDLVVYDFIKNNPCDIIVWVNPTSPLQKGGEIRKVVEYFLKEKLDSLVTVKDEQVHCIYKGRPVNFKINGVFAKTQDIVPVQPFVYSLMMWRTGAFLKNFEKNGYALLCGKAGYYPVSKEAGIIIKRPEDLMFAEYLMRIVAGCGDYKVRYDRAAKHAKRIRTK